MSRHKTIVNETIPKLYLSFGICVFEPVKLKVLYLNLNMIFEPMLKV